jgi:hypothetical protein
MRVDARGNVMVGPADPTDRRWCLRCRGLAEKEGAAVGHKIRDCPWGRLPDAEYYDKVRSLRQFIAE